MAHHHRIVHQTSRNLSDSAAPLQDPDGIPMHPEDALALMEWIIAKQEGSVPSMRVMGTRPYPD